MNNKPMRVALGQKWSFKGNEPAEVIGIRGSTAYLILDEVDTLDKWEPERFFTMPLNDDGEPMYPTKWSQEVSDIVMTNWSATGVEHDRFQRTPDGDINNCSLAHGEPEAGCQICKGSCPDRARIEQKNAQIESGAKEQATSASKYKVDWQSAHSWPDEELRERAFKLFCSLVHTAEYKEQIVLRCHAEKLAQIAYACAEAFDAETKRREEKREGKQ